MGGGDRVHVFQTLSDLHTIQSASHNKILQTFACDILRASDLNEPRSTVLGRGLSAAVDQ